MLRMRRITQILAAAIAAVSGVTAANADITLQISYVTVTGNNNANNLHNNGWIGVKITAIADAVTTNFPASTVSGFDLSTGTNGIFATALQQTTKLSDPGNTGVWTNAAPTLQGTTPVNTTSNLVDSFFDSFVVNTSSQGFSPASPLVENSNQNSPVGPGYGAVANPPYDHSPLTEAMSNANGSGLAVLGSGPGDGNGDGFTANNFGAGTSLKGAGAYTLLQQATQNIAYIIVPAASNIQFLGEVIGDFTDGTASANVSHVDLLIANPNFAPTPEPASLGVLALGGLALLARRKRA